MTDVSAVTVSPAWAVWLVLLPLAGAALSFILGRCAARRLTVLAAPGILLCACGLYRQVGESGPLRYAVGGWGAPIGIDWRVDGLSVLMLLMTAVVGSGVSVYALGYFPRKPAGGNGRSDALFWPLWLFLWAALNALFLSADIFNIYVTLELVGLAAVALVAYSGTAAAVRAATRYFFVAALGSLCYLLGVALVYSAYGVLDIVALGKLMAPGPTSWAAIALMTAGLLAKGALFPMHFWLPPAHANAPSPVSAALSALVVKAAFYLILRLWFQAFGAALTPGAGMLLGLLGAAAILWGSVLALCQTRLKKLVAYSTVAQLGYLFLPFPMALTTRSSAAGCAVDWAAPALSGGIYHALSHAAAKAAMFLAAGIVIQVLGHDRVKELAGVGQRVPLTAFAVGLAGVSLMGLPPSGGFAAKWLLLNAALQSGQWWWAVVIVSGSLLAAGYLFRAWRYAYVVKQPESAWRTVPLGMELMALLLAATSMLLGFLAPYPLALLKSGM